MLIILLSWLIITAIVYPLGFYFNDWLSRRFSMEYGYGSHFTFICLSGMMIVTVLSTILSFFMGLDLIAFCIVSGLSVLAFLLRKKGLYDSLRINFANLRSTAPAVILIFIAFSFIIARLSYEPSSHHDDGLYYSTSIKWLQDYGTIKGISNLNHRIGFNSSWHILQAQFGFPFLKSGLFNDMNGLIYLYIFLYSLGGLNKLIKKNSSFPTVLQAIFFIPALAFHYGASSDLALFNMNYLGSSTPDMPVSMMLWFMFVIFMVQKDKGSRGPGLTDLLILFYSVWIITIKLSSAPILLLSAYILYKLLKAKLYRGIFVICGLCALLICPWLLRNVFLTGYLIFPFSAIDIFPVDWKVGIETVKWYENAVKAYAVGTDVNVTFNQHFNDWLLPWLKRQNYINHVLFFTSILATIVYAVVAMVGLLINRRWPKNPAPAVNGRFIFANLTLLLSILFWLTKAPDFRFGYGFLCIYCIIFVCFILTYFLGHNVTYVRLPYYLFLAHLVINHYESVWNLKSFVRLPIEYRLPKETYKRTINEIPITIVTHEDSWNATLPVANEHDLNISNCTPRGRTIKSGFRSNPKKSTAQ